MRRLLSLALVFAAGCGLSFPAEYRVEDLRILDISLDPAEIPVIAPGFTATTAEQLTQLVISNPNEQTVKMTALVAHPDLDATFTYDWKACAPAFGDLPCPNRDRVDLVREDAQTVEFQPILFLRDQLLQSENPDQALAELASDPRDLLNGLYARLILRTAVQNASVQVDTPELDGEKRLVIFDPSLVRTTVREAQRLGETGMVPMVAGLDLPSLCTQASDIEVQAIDEFLLARQPNQPPALIGMFFEVRTATSVSLQPVERGIELEPNEEVVFRPVVDLGRRESFRAIDDTCHLADLEETHVVSWFTNKGDLSRRLSVFGPIPEPDRETTTYTAPPADELEQDETRVRIWAVLRDGRGASVHTSFDILVRR